MYYEPFLDYARQRNDALVKRIALEKQLKALKPPKSRLRDRLLLQISDFLLAAGERIRPQEIQVDLWESPWKKVDVGVGGWRSQPPTPTSGPCHSKSQRAIQVYNEVASKNCHYYADLT